MILSVKHRKTVGNEEKKRFDAFHLSRPVTVSELDKITQVKKTITMSPSTEKRLSVKAKTLLKQKKIKTELIKRQGRPIGIKADVVKNALNLHKVGFSFRKIQEKTGLPKSTLHYIVKHAKRNRIKYKDMTVFID